MRANVENVKRKKKVELIYRKDREIRNIDDLKYCKDFARNAIFKNDVRDIRQVLEWVFENFIQYSDRIIIQVLQ